MTRSTKASHAVLRLRERSNQAPYSMLSMADGRFILTLAKEQGGAENQCEPLELDAFVAFVNGINKLAPKKVSKLEQAFDAKLQAARDKTTQA